MGTIIERAVLGIVLAAVSLLPLAALGAPNFEEGMWEMKGEIKFEGAMKMNGKAIPLKSMPLHYKKCLTNKDMVPHEEGKNQKCVKTEKMSGNTLSWTMKCTEPNGIVIVNTGSGVFSRTSFEGKARSVMTDSQGQKTTANATMKGNRLGACK